MNTRVKRLTLPIGAVAATALLGASFAAAPAQAAGDTASDPLALSGVAAKAIAAYWYANNEANLVNSTPYNAETQIVVKKLKSVVPKGDDGRAGIVPAIGDEKKSTSTSKNVNLPRTTGKVFFVGADGKNHWCTATSIQSTYHNLVATAGHCVYDTVSNAQTLDKWVFVPAFFQSKTPYGLYVGKQAFTHFDFDNFEDGDRDYAFVTVYNGVQAPHDGLKTPNDIPGAWKETTEAEYNLFPPEYRFKDGRKFFVAKFVDAGRLGDAVGGQGLAYNQKIGPKVFVFGYPSGAHPDGNHAFSGKTLKWSYGATFKASSAAINAQELIAVKSSFTGEGSSGSAWLLKYKNTRRLGYLNGLTIGVSDTNGNDRIDTSVSAYFDGELFGVYSAAKNLWSGSIA